MTYLAHHILMVMHGNMKLILTCAGTRCVHDHFTVPRRTPVDTTVAVLSTCVLRRVSAYWIAAPFVVFLITPTITYVLIYKKYLVHTGIRQGAER